MPKTEDTAGAGQDMVQTTVQEASADLTLLPPKLAISEAPSQDLQDATGACFIPAERQEEADDAAPGETKSSTIPELTAWLANLLQQPNPAPALPTPANLPQSHAQTDCMGISKPSASAHSSILQTWPDLMHVKAAAAPDDEAKGAPLTNEICSVLPAPSPGRKAPTAVEVEPTGSTAAKAAGSEAIPVQAPAVHRQPLTEAHSDTNQALALPATSASIMAKPAASSPVSSAAAPLDTYLPHVVQSPAFTPAFSARVATLMRDGLEHARVHLNPVEMGPVSVRLSLDGQQVRVDMTAEVAATRQILEQALPTLAGALRDAGFMLSGGGVHQPASESKSFSGQDPSGAASSQANATLGQGADSTAGGSTGGAGAQGGQPQAAGQGWTGDSRRFNEQTVTVGSDTADNAVQLTAPAMGRTGSRLVDTFA